MNECTHDYDYYRDIFRGQTMPFAYLDLDLLDENIRADQVSHWRQTGAAGLQVAAQCCRYSAYS